MRNVLIGFFGIFIVESFIGLIWNILIYSPFCCVGFLTFKYVTLNFQCYWAIGVVAGFIGMFLFSIIIAMIGRIKSFLQEKGNILWIFPFLLNVCLISGVPFFIGFNISNSFFGTEQMKPIELNILNVVGGLMLAIPSYLGISKRA